MILQRLPWHGGILVGPTAGSIEPELVLMLRYLNLILTALAVCALCVVLSPATSIAGTILEMNLGNVVNDIEYDGTTLHTVIENVATTGNQDTGVQFLGILDPLFTDILTTNQASFTLSGLVPDGQASLIVNS